MKETKTIENKIEQPTLLAENSQTSKQAELFKNRLKKRSKHLLKWAKRNGIFAFRLYDKDIPEIPVALDIYFEHSDSANKNNQAGFLPEKAFAVLFLYKRPYEKSFKEEELWISVIIDSIAEVLNIAKEKIFFKIREKQKGSLQYKKLNSTQEKIIVKEGKCLFFVNPKDYLDTGLFLDHRPTRLKIFDEARGKKVLNLFAYTGSFSAHALAGGAAEVVSVDLSNTYLNWAKENLRLNNLDEKKAVFVKSCGVKFLEEATAKHKKWDIIICDPPSFSNSKSAAIFDVNKDWKKLCLLCLSVLTKDGVLYFSSNSQRLKFDTEILSKEFEKTVNLKKQNGKTLEIRDLSSESIPEDFRNKKIHKLWKIKKITASI